MTRLILASLAATAMLVMPGKSSAVAQQGQETDWSFISRHAGSGSFSGEYVVKKQTHKAPRRFDPARPPYGSGLNRLTHEGNSPRADTAPGDAVPVPYPNSAGTAPE